MAPRSSIEKLPEDVRRWLERALTENGFSGYVELESLLREKGYSISKSAIHRYGKQIESRLKAIKDSAEIAKLITEQVDDEGDSQSDALMRLVQTDLMNLLIEARNVESLSVKDRLKALGMIGKNIASMTTASVKLKEYQAEHKAKVQAKLDELARTADKDGTDLPTLERVRQSILEVYGINQ
ncbi:DUF3486 family protein [Avibacterium paragallinarum]|uniref:Bacteriophage Mu GP27-like protein n=1 Tax=Avibacterium paragallinarum TaxID=728 RepID=A0A377I7G0_AVIPA|nr:DUF3486 family protein [Avibacterium paragallinarum]POY46147.1 DUF3486 domain-containing protein [Avibacterium paragallinarum]RZN74521.1 DUF3486 family protein [Avibacterium paragallinarum]CDF99252.1 Putative uncharacterized protein [Avibacterium paragallinarum JF4211]STO70970.1 bacteriophage Mu GP27-like protein [Avibacterium paragallinarum]